MFGHKSIKITQHYAKIMDKKVSEDMRALSRKLAGFVQQSSMILQEKS